MDIKDSMAEDHTALFHKIFTTVFFELIMTDWKQREILRCATEIFSSEVIPCRH